MSVPDKPIVGHNVIPFFAERLRPFHKPIPRRLSNRKVKKEKISTDYCTTPHLVARDGLENHQRPVPGR
jgi:hypothetical protein